MNLIKTLVLFGGKAKCGCLAWAMGGREILFNNILGKFPATGIGVLEFAMGECARRRSRLRGRFEKHCRTDQGILSDDLVWHCYVP